MQSFVVHPLIRENTVEPRLYQEVLAARVLDKGNSLIVAPTALGKTIVAVLVAANVLEKQPESKILILAPTKPLCQQHELSFKKLLNLGEEKISLFTGTTPIKKREELWKESAVVTATPQTIENDLITGRLKLSEVSLIVFDEAHKAAGDYAYVFIAQQYMKQAKKPLILALTASPGGYEEKIKDVCKNLYINNVEIKTAKDEDVKPYVKPIEINWIKVDLPEQYLEVKKELNEFVKEQVRVLKKMGYGRRLHLNFQRQKDLIALQIEIRKDLVRRAKKNPMVYQASSSIAALLKVVHAIALIETQGASSLNEYFARMNALSEKPGSPKAVKKILKDERIKKSIELSKKLEEEKVQHPKLLELKHLLQEQFALNPESRVIVFNHFRESGKVLYKELSTVEGVRPLRFIGQASKEADKGMSQKEQKKALEELKEGKYNTLIATSVAEEGIDLPQVDMVVFFETVPSEIRSIQRRGRTGRLSKGKCYILMAKNTRDEAYYWSSQRKEEQMHSTLSEMKKTDFAKKYELGKQATLSKYVETAKSQVLVYADTREQSSSVTKKLMELGAFVKVKQLEVGDFVLTDDIVVERKTTEDFLESIIDGRLFSQLNKMHDNYSMPLILIEGKKEELFTARNIHRNAIIGALTSVVLDYKTPVLFTKGEEETAEFLYVTAKREQLGKEKDIKLRVGRKGLSIQEQQRFIVESLPFVGAKLAKNLLKEFGSVKKVFTATEKRLQKVEKIGEKKAKLIRKTIEEEYKED